MLLPRLRMALVGFPDPALPQTLLRARSRPGWETASLDDADALWVAGQSARMESDGLVRVWNGEGKPAVVLHLNSLQRPLTFTQPLVDPRLQVADRVDLHNPGNVDQALRRTEQFLRAVLLQLTMGQQIAERLLTLTAHTYHVTLKEKLVAVVSVPGRMGIELSTDPEELAEARWVARPPHARDIPKWFLPTSFAECLWLYASRTRTELLPHRYRSAPLYFRCVPPVPQRLMQNVHYAVLAELATAPRTFAELQEAIGLPEPELDAALTVLYFAGSITCNAARAARGGAASTRDAVTASELRNSIFPPVAPAPGVPDATMPAPLEWRP
ncbi:MAG TPA: hypothetical protein VFM98_12515 [Ramlibacter sp.]|uniref:hypothetical protein n=1 Tax=Ramlibacter sp. TaxID=1917967 RepID=UPI002D7E5751|nr:hypothetical protein [Ramlibacter sp.]HET8746422.1 hypothetical protein [Ramlibacter sp.]